jgi:cobalt-precorrin-5B (C1)-methyltransferase
VAAVLERFSEECGRKLRVRVAMVDFEGEHVVAATEARWVTWQSR